MKLITNTYEIKSMYHGYDKSKEAISLDDYNRMKTSLVMALRNNCLVQSILNESYYPNGSVRDGVYISEQFLMPKGVVLQLRSLSQKGVQYVDVIRTSWFQPQYITDMVKTMGGIKVDSSVKKIDPANAVKKIFSKKTNKTLEEFMGA